jgi:hypothetical protein
MKLPQTGGCLCNVVRYEINRAPTMVYACHCTACQHQTGSAFSMALVVEEDAFHFKAKVEPRSLQRPTDSGRTATQWVCQECGSWVCSGPQPGLPRPAGAIRAVRAGTLDDTSWLQPAAHFWTRSAHPWIALPEGVPRFETQPPNFDWMRSPEKPRLSRAAR